MTTRISDVEWMIEPDNGNDREYARLLVRADKDGLNIDGQAILTWEEINAAEFQAIHKQNATR